MLVDASAAESIAFAGRTWTSWSPIAALSAAVFYINRVLRVTEGVLYSSTAAGLIAMVLGYETPHQYLCVAWLAFAALLFEAGFRWRQAEFRYQSYIVGALGTGAACDRECARRHIQLAAARHLRGFALCRHAAYRLSR